MSEPYDIAWAAEDVLVIRRRGFMSLEQANHYFAESKQAIDGAPPRWGLVVDTSDAVAQSEEVTAVLQEQMNYTATSGARRVAVVTGRVVGTMQVMRLNASVGWAPDAITFHKSYDDAYADVQKALIDS